MKRSIIFAAAIGMAGLGASFVGCNGGNGTTDGGGNNNGGDVTKDQLHGTFTTYAVNSLTLPQDNKQFAIDLNGDGKVDNQMGNIIGTLATQNLDAQSGVDQSIADGSVVVLLSMQSMDMKTDAAVGLTFYIGKTFNSMPRKNDAGMAIPDGGCDGCPDFSGMGMFTVDQGQSPVLFLGPLASGKFKSNNPITTKNPVSVTLKIALIQGAAPIPLVLNGAQAEFTVGTDKASGKPGLLDGRLRGSIKKSDVDNTIIPAVASLLTMRIQAEPGSPSSKQIASIFDTGGCGMAKAGDGKIDTCEVATNSIIMAVLAPDIQVFDGSGNYAPNAKNTMKDSLSIAAAWTAVQATFQRP